MEPQKKSSPLDVFLNISSIVLIYFISINFIGLLFYFINKIFPDIITGYLDFSSAAIKWNLSLLVVLFPVYIYVARFIMKDTDRNPEKSELRVKKWLSYLTIFVALGAIVGDVIALIYNFLNGELTSRFALKALSVFLVSIFVFWWLRFDLRRKPGEFPSSAKKLSLLGIALISLGIIAGFFVAGSPMSARKMALDQTRIYDLQNIQGRIIYFWQNKKTLPKSLTDLNSQIDGYIVPSDPESNSSYEYRAIDNLSFELCATFNLPSSDMKNGEVIPLSGNYYPSLGENWAHKDGRVCFERTIDKDFYELKK